MQRFCATTGVVALVGATVVTGLPAKASQEMRVANANIRLTADSSSIANIPINLIYALANVPYNEVQAFDELARALLFTGNWFVGSSTNIWGSDPADPGHYQSVIDLLVPFPALSGPAGHQLSMLAAAELPVNAACGALTCPPLVPLQPITGITAIDKTIWSAAILLGYPFPLLNNFFQVPLSQLMAGYTFGDIVDPAGPVQSGYGFEGTIPGPNGEPLMPWSGTTFTLNPLAPWMNFFNSLTATPPDPADGIKLASASEISQTLAAVLAGLVIDFNPFVPGSPLCPGECALPASLTTEGIVKSILAGSPGNPLIEQWLTDTANGTANGPTQEQIDSAIALLQPELAAFKFDPGTTAAINAALNLINPVLPIIAGHSGLLGAYDGPALLSDIVRLLGFGAASSAVEPQIASTATPLSDNVSQKAASPTSGALDGTKAMVANLKPATGASGGHDDSTGTEVTLDSASTTTDPQPTGELDPTEGEPAENPKPTTSADRTVDGNKVQPHRVGGLDTPRGLSGAVNSVMSVVNSTISSVTGVLKGASGQSGDAKDSPTSAGTEKRGGVDHQAN
ncbi:hypothetical protein Mycsm_05865 [Mycobacterium sp. JS623]|nr:hypothetical protein Mycsm_05865 [Mycobacterium sp. JS623]